MTNDATDLEELVLEFDVARMILAEEEEEEEANIVVSLRDVTQQKQSEEALRESEEQFRRLIELSPAGVIIVDTEGTIRLSNPAMVQMLGAKDKKDIVGRKMLSFIAPEQQEHCMQCFSSVLGNGSVPTRTETTVVRLGDSSFPAEVEAGNYLWQGRPAVQLIIHDITERKRAEEVLRESQQKYAELVNSVEGIVWEADARTFQFTFVSGQAERLLGYPTERWLNEPTFWKDHIHPEDRDWAVDFCVTATAEKRSHDFEYRMNAADGRTVWLRDIVTVLVENDQPVKLRGVMIDITEHKRTEAERQAIFEITQGVNITANLDELFRIIHESLKKVTYVENFFIALYERRTGMFTFPYFVDQFDAPPAAAKVGKSGTAYVFRTGRPTLMTQETFRQLMEQGEIELVGTASPCWLGVPLKTPRETIGVLVVQHYEDEHAYCERDVEFFASVGSQVAMAIERKRASEALSKLSGAVEQTADNVFITDREGRIEYVNPSFEELTGYTKEEVLGKRARILKSGKHEQGFYERLWRIILSGEVFRDVVINKKKNGELYYEEKTITPLKDSEGRITHFVSTGKDITERIQLEEQVRQSQKMEAIGVLAGGVAHDFNNILTVITGYSQLLLNRISSDDPLRKHAEEIMKAADRAASLTRQLLAFSRKQTLQPKVLDLNGAVENIEKMLHRLIGEDIELITVLGPGLWSVQVDPGQIEQVIMNLAVNARDAMPQGGKLTLETANVELDESFVRQHTMVQPGPYVMLTVSDTGHGMDAKTQARIFEPFFTTKEKGKGTGLGLATVYGIVKQSGGYIWVSSELGRGTTFTVHLPKVVGVAEKIEPKRAVAKVSRGTETILLVEDEAAILELAHDILQMNGYFVLQAANGVEALQIGKRHQGPIHLLLTDTVMPQMDGPELAGRLAKLRPEIRVLYMSGYTDSEVVYRGGLNVDTAFMQKPFTMDGLTQKVREVLDAAHER